VKFRGILWLYAQELVPFAASTKWRKGKPEVMEDGEKVIVATERG
jgi:hypothetical protein